MTVEPDVQSTSPPGHDAPGDPACRDADEEAPPRRAKAGNYAGLLAVAAMASGLLLGVLLAASFGMGGDVRAGGGSLFAAGGLAQALSDDMSGSRGIGPSFWSKDGFFCRAFDTRTGKQAGLAGVACREGAGWRIRIVATAIETAEMPANVRSTMDSLIVGSPLNAAAELQARRQGWRPR